MLLTYFCAVKIKYYTLIILLIAAAFFGGRYSFAEFSNSLEDIKAMNAEYLSARKCLEGIKKGLTNEKQILQCLGEPLSTADVKKPIMAEEVAQVLKSHFLPPLNAWVDPKLFEDYPVPSGEQKVLIYFFKHLDNRPIAMQKSGVLKHRGDMTLAVLITVNTKTGVVENLKEYPYGWLCS